MSQAVCRRRKINVTRQTKGKEKLEYGRYRHRHPPITIASMYSYNTYMKLISLAMFCSCDFRKDTLSAKGQQSVVCGERMYIRFIQ